MDISLSIRPIEEKDNNWLKQVFQAQFGSERIALRGKVINAIDTQGFIAEEKGERVGIILYELQKDNIEIIALVSLSPQQGVGTALIKSIIELAKKVNRQSITVITTNDNTQALRFYQKRGFAITGFFPDAVKALRKLKPELPVFGNDRIPIRDEIELQIELMSQS